MAENPDSQPPLSLSDALTEAQIIKEIGTWGERENNIVDLVVDARVAEEFKLKFLQTSKVDIASQIYEKLEQSSPNLVNLMKDRVEATAGLVGYRIRHQSNLNSKSEEYQIKSLANQQKNAKMDIQQVMSKIVEVKKAHADYLPTHEAFSKAVSILTKDDYFNKDNDGELGYLLSAVTAQFQIDARLRSNPHVNEALNGVDVDKSYDKQLKYNDNKDKQVK